MEPQEVDCWHWQVATPSPRIKRKKRKRKGKKIKVNAYVLENCGNYALAGDWTMISSYMAHKVLATMHA